MRLNHTLSSTLFAIAACVGPVLAAAPELARGITAFQQRRWMTAMDEFIVVLQHDPRNMEAHLYMNLIARELEDQRKSEVNTRRLNYLSQASKSLEENRLDNQTLDKALLDTTANAAGERERRWRELSQRALIQSRVGDLPAAFDLVLSVLAEDASNAEARRTLSELQAEAHDRLGHDSLTALDRAILEGFSAYADADYEAAVRSWTTARDLMAQTEQALPAQEKVDQFHFGAYQERAEARVHESRENDRIRALFADGLAKFQRQEFDAALDAFRQVALLNPAYPELGVYLVQSEAAVELKRTRSWSEAKRKTLAEALALGIDRFEKGQFGDAKVAFQKVLEIDPEHERAKLYLQQIESQKPQQADPVAAQQHYEAGLIAYASGQAEQAIREWHIALRLDPDNPKAATAVTKVQREMEMSKELP